MLTNHACIVFLEVSQKRFGLRIRAAGSGRVSMIGILEEDSARNCSGGRGLLDCFRIYWYSLKLTPLWFSRATLAQYLLGTIIEASIALMKSALSPFLNKLFFSFCP